MKRNIFKRSIGALGFCAIAAVTTGCGAIYEESDCVESATTLQFTYTMNLKHSDAFDWAVKSVHVLMFDEEGLLRYQWKMPKSALVGGNKLPITVEPGVYDILAWAGEYHLSAVVPNGEIGKTRLEEYTLFVNRLEGGIINEDIEDFFHCLRRVHLPYSSPKNPHNEILDLTKNTNSVNIVLQQLSGDPVDMKEFSITINDENGWLEHDNTFKKDVRLTYHPWHVSSGSVDISRSPNKATLGAMVGNMTVSRLMPATQPRVTVTRRDGTKVFSIPLIDYALLVKGKYDESMPDQEYLDRQDEYNMTFFLDENNNWINTEIIINDWKVVPFDVDLDE